MSLVKLMVLIDQFVGSADTQRCKTIKETHASELLDGSSDYIITYQDKDGDWMLVGDVPWQYVFALNLFPFIICICYLNDPFMCVFILLRMFLGSVKRLRIMRTAAETRVGK